MKRQFGKCRHWILALLLASTSGVARSQSLKLAWQQDFDKPVQWYVRTSPGILLVWTEKTLTALDGTDGRQLWAFTELETKKWNMGGVEPSVERGRNVIELPGLGIVLLNRIKFANDSEPKLSAINLMTGKRLWVQDQVDDLMTAVPVYESGAVILVSRRLDKKMLATELASTAITPVPLVLQLNPYMKPYPFHFEIERRDLATGSLQWSTEYPRRFFPGTTAVQVIGENILLSYSNHLYGCLDAKNGKVLWEDKEGVIRSAKPALPILASDGRVIYGAKEVLAVQPEENKIGWKMENLGRITGIFVHEGLTVAIGEKMIAAVDSQTGVEKWRSRTHGDTTNLLWDKESDNLIYADYKGLHRIERSSGKPVLDVNMHLESSPYYLRMASPGCVLAITHQETDCFSPKTGEKLFTEGRLTALYRGEAYQDVWPMPEDGQELVRMVEMPESEAEWEAIRHNSLLPADIFAKVAESSKQTEGLSDVYQTDIKEGEHKIWWVDQATNKQMVIRPSAEKHDVSLPMKKVFAVNEKVLWAASIEEK